MITPKSQNQRRQISTESFVTCIGFLKEPMNIEEVLAEYGFNRLFNTTIAQTGISSTIYSPDALKRNPQFDLCQTTLTDWRNITKEPVSSEGILMVRYPLPADLAQKYVGLLNYFSARNDIIID